MSFPLNLVAETVLAVLAATQVEDGGAALSTAGGLLWASLPALFVGVRTLSSAYFVCQPHKLPPMLFSEEHFAERYSLIMLIFLGEVVAAGGVAGSATDAGLPIAAIVTAFECFLIAFIAQPSARATDAC